MATPRAIPPRRLTALRCRSQLLAGTPAADPVEAVGRLLAVQAQDPRGFRLAVRSRTDGLTAADVDRALTVRPLAGGHHPQPGHPPPGPGRGLLVAARSSPPRRSSTRRRPAAQPGPASSPADAGQGGRWWSTPLWPLKAR